MTRCLGFIRNSGGRTIARCDRETGHDGVCRGTIWDASNDTIYWEQPK